MPRKERYDQEPLRPFVTNTTPAALEWWPTLRDAPPTPLWPTRSRFLKTWSIAAPPRSDVESGDGAGILVQLPDAFFRQIFGDALPPAGEYGVANWMIPPVLDLAKVRREMDEVLASVGLSTLGWRSVPVNSSLLGPTSKASEPLFFQHLIGRDINASTYDLERSLFCARKVIEHSLEVYASSCSSRVLIYKEC